MLKMPASDVTMSYWSEMHEHIRVELETLLDGLDEDMIFVPTPSGYAFCGCTTCVVREVVGMVADHIEIGRPRG